MGAEGLSKVKVYGFSISLDGYGAGPSQDEAHPIGLRGNELHTWFYPTKSFRKMTGQEGGTGGIDNDFAEKSFDNVGAWIMGRNMFGPIRGPWTNDDWKGWWGDNPPFHVPVFVLTHHERESLEMKGGTVFHFVTDGIKSAVEKAKVAASGKDVRIGGGVSTIRQCLQAGYVDEIKYELSPIFLGSGEPLFSEIDIPALGFHKIERVSGEGATHITLKK